MSDFEDKVVVITGVLCFAHCRPSDARPVQHAALVQGGRTGLPGEDFSKLDCL